jgi:hypothetical protein
LNRIPAADRVGILTDEFLDTRGLPSGAAVQPAVLAALSGVDAPVGVLAHMLRKHPGERSNAMIAATALAVVGLVVVAFLNRIP